MGVESISSQRLSEIQQLLIWHATTGCLRYASPKPEFAKVSKIERRLIEQFRLQACPDMSFMGALKRAVELGSELRPC